MVTPCTLVHTYARSPPCLRPHQRHITSLYAALATSWILPCQNPLCDFSCTPHNSEFTGIPTIHCQKPCASYTKPCIAANMQNIPVWSCSPEAHVSRRDAREKIICTTHLEYSSTLHTDSKFGKQCKKERRMKTHTHTEHEALQARNSATLASVVYTGNQKRNTAKYMPVHTGFHPDLSAQCIFVHHPNMYSVQLEQTAMCQKWTLRNGNQ